MQSSRKTLKIVLVVLTCVVLLAVGLHWWRARGTSAIPVHVRYENASGSVAALAFLPSGESLFIGSFDGSGVAVDTKAWRPQSQMQTQVALSAMAISPDGRTFISGGHVGEDVGSLGSEVKIWDISQGLAEAVLLNTISGASSRMPARIYVAPDASRFAVV